MLKRVFSVLLSVLILSSAFSFCFTAEATDYGDYYYVYQKSQLKEMEARANELLYGIRGNNTLTDVEKALLIHDRMILNSRYDTTLSKFYAYDNIVKGTSVCNGYAYAYKYMLGLVGIKSTVEVSEKMNHAWNVVYIGNSRYYVDVTWDDPLPDEIGRVSHRCFLLSAKKLYSTEHNYNDYDMSLKDTKYDDYFWHNIDTAFQLVGNKIYYFDNNKGTVNEFRSRSTLLAISQYKKKVYDSKTNMYTIYTCNYFKNSKMSSDDKYLYFSLDNSIYRLDLETKSECIVYTVPDSTEYYNTIKSFAVDAGCFHYVYLKNNKTDVEIKVKYNFFRYKRFPDVIYGEWYFDAVNYTTYNGLFSGYQNGKFGSADKILRQDFILVLAKFDNVNLSSYNYKSNFADVKQNAYYNAAINWAKEKGICSGYQNGLFGVNDKITREQLITFLYKYAKYKNDSVSCGSFDNIIYQYQDSVNVSDFAKDAVSWAVSNNVISGKNGKYIAPKDFSLRVEIAQIFYNLSKNSLF